MSNYSTTKLTSLFLTFFNFNKFGLIVNTIINIFMCPKGLHFTRFRHLPTGCDNLTKNLLS